MLLLYCKYKTLYTQTKQISIIFQASYAFDINTHIKSSIFKKQLALQYDADEAQVNACIDSFINELILIIMVDAMRVSNCVKDIDMADELSTFFDTMGESLVDVFPKIETQFTELMQLAMETNDLRGIVSATRKSLSLVMQIYEVLFQEFGAFIDNLVDIIEEENAGPCVTKSVGKLILNYIEKIQEMLECIKKPKFQKEWRMPRDQL